MVLSLLILINIHFFFTNINCIGLTEDPWPLWGGNLQNQQRSSSSRSKINGKNIFDLEEQCVYLSEGGTHFRGFVTIDIDGNGYFTDYSGYVTSVNLDNCEENWRVNIASLLGYNKDTVRIVSRNSLTIFENSNNEKGLLFGSPNEIFQNIGFGPLDGCFAIALNIFDGSLMWNTKIGDGTDYAYCHCHGFIVDKNSEYAYGILSSLANWVPPDQSSFRGQLIKININSGTIVDRWYPIPDIYNGLASDDDTYTGGGIWGFPAIINDYIVFGVGNLYSYPKYIEDCLLDNNNEYISFTNNPYNPCNEDMSAFNKHKCLEEGIYHDAYVILNKHTFEVESAVPIHGVDAWAPFCPEFKRNGNQWWPTDDIECNLAYNGPDADVVGIAVYKNPYDNKHYGITHSKGGQLYVFKIPSGEVVIGKKIGPWTPAGGGLYSLAVNEKRQLAFLTQTGGGFFDDLTSIYPEIMANGDIVYGAGSIHAIDLHTGFTKYQIVNPYGHINNDTLCHEYNNFCSEYEDITADGSCFRAFDGSDMLNPSQTVKDNLGENGVIYPDKTEDRLPFNYLKRAFFRAHIGMNNNLIFIPSMTGDVFIHNIHNGKYYRSLTCPNEYDADLQSWNRAAIKSGVTVTGDRVVFYCGDGFGNEYGNQLMSFKLKKKRKHNYY